MGVGIWGFFWGGRSPGCPSDHPSPSWAGSDRFAILSWLEPRKATQHTYNGRMEAQDYSHLQHPSLLPKSAMLAQEGERGRRTRPRAEKPELGKRKRRHRGTYQPSFEGGGGWKGGGNRVSHVGQRRASPTTSAGVISGGAVMVGWSKVGGGIWTGSSWKGKSRWRMVFCWEGIKCRATDPPPPLPPNLAISSVSSRANFLNCCFCFIPILIGWGLMCIINNCSAFCPLSRAPVQSLSGMDAKCQCNAPPCPSL